MHSCMSCYHHSKWSQWKSKSVSRLLFSRHINSAKKSWFSNLFFFTCAPDDGPGELDLTGSSVPDVVRIERARLHGICGARPSGSLQCTWTPKSSWVFLRVCMCVYACVCVCVCVRAQKKGMPIHKYWFYWCKHNKHGSTGKRTLFLIWFFKLLRNRLLSLFFPWMLYSSWTQIKL